jgi:hypothetical protein
MTIRLAWLTLVLICGSVVGLRAVHASELPFNVLNGTWAGAGTLIYDSGAPDKLTCLGYYRSTNDGKSLGVALRCKGQPDKIEFRTKLTSADGKISGTWEERTNNASGTASGTATANNIHLDFDGGLRGTMSIEFSASSQAVAVTISTDGSEIKGAQVTLNRR